MEVIVKEKKEKENKYPYIGITECKCIVLFDNPEEGICLQIGDAEEHEVGKYSKAWNEHNFEEFKGEITLRND